MITERLKKRILIFSVIPILAIISFFIQDIYLKAASILIIVIYVGFIIFLRDSIHVEETTAAEPEVVPEPPTYQPDAGESFTIISANKNIEVITDDNYVPELHVGKRQYFKPPDLKESFEKIATEPLPPGVGQDEQFSFLLEKILTSIKEAYYAHTAVFFGIIKEKKN